jgi:hypothetical protein
MIAAIFAFFGSLLTGFTAWILGFMSAKVLYRIAILGFFFGLVATALTALYGVIGTISIPYPPLWTDLINFILPSNFSTCVTILISTKVALWVWNWKKYFFERLAFGE